MVGREKDRGRERGGRGSERVLFARTVGRRAYCPQKMSAGGVAAEAEAIGVPPLPHAAAAAAIGVAATDGE